MIHSFKLLRDGGSAVTGGDDGAAGFGTVVMPWTGVAWRTRGSSALLRPARSSSIVKMRRSGSSEIARSTTSTNAGGASGRRLVIGGGLLVVMLATVAARPSPVYATFCVAIS